MQIAVRPADKLAPLLLAEERRQAAQQSQEQRQGLFGHLVGQHAGGAGDDDVRLDDRRRQAVIQPGRRRLHPPQPAPGDHRVPIDRHLGMAAKDVGRQQLAGDALLAGIDDLGPRRRRGDLAEMLGFDRITQNDAH